MDLDTLDRPWCAAGDPFIPPLKTKTRMPRCPQGHAIPSADHPCEVCRVIEEQQKNVQEWRVEDARRAEESKLLRLIY